MEGDRIRGGGERGLFRKLVSMAGEEHGTVCDTVQCL